MTTTARMPSGATTEGAGSDARNGATKEATNEATSQATNGALKEATSEASKGATSGATVGPVWTAAAVAGGHGSVMVTGGPPGWAAWAVARLDFGRVMRRLERRRRAARYGSRWGSQWRLALRKRADRGMTTAEYAMGTLAACAFAAVLFKVVTSGSVSSALSSLIGRALHAPV